MCKFKRRSTRVSFLLFAFLVPTLSNAAVINVIQDDYNFDLNANGVSSISEHVTGIASKEGTHSFGGRQTTPGGDWMEGRETVSVVHQMLIQI